MGQEVGIEAGIGLVIAAGILTRKEAIMIQTEIVKEIVRLQAATAYTATIPKLKPPRRPNRDRQRNRSTSSSNSLHSYNTEIKTAEEIQQFLTSKKTEKPMQTSGSSASNSNQTTDVFGFISTGEPKPPGDDDIIPF